MNLITSIKTIQKIETYSDYIVLLFMTLGCKVNQYETEAMEELFLQNQYDLVNFDEVADVYVVNTCTVTAMSDKIKTDDSTSKKINPSAIGQQ